jgi:8-oxo-dGTP diphosphatase
VLILLRHASAGSKKKWRGDDVQRPLDELGRRQADLLADALAAYEPRRIVTSRYLRCRQTVEPLATRLDLEPEEHPALETDADERAARAALAELSRGDGVAIACTHRELYEALFGESPPKAGSLLLDEELRVTGRLGPPL